MEIQGLQNPQVIDWNAFVDFRDGLIDSAPQIESLLAELKKTPDDLSRITQLFRLFHNIKGDAGLCRLPFVIPLIHGVETILSRMRSNELAFSDLLAEVILLTLDRLEQTIELLGDHESAAALALPTLALGLEGLSQQGADSIDASAIRLIETVTGFRPGLSKLPQRDASNAARNNAERHEDLNFFHQLALQLETRSPLFTGRTARNLELALETNRAAGCRVNPIQLEAAIYLHDIGMMFLPENYWLKIESLDESARQKINLHPAWGAGLTARMVGWQDAAQMIIQHHEKPNGSGYPNQLMHSEICDGAKILAIVDAFDAILLRHSHRGQQRSILRAIAEINASDRQFSAEWIAPFNQVIRQMLENK
ncbi:HD domain-containing protein [Deefgea piscis]|uniref:HD domain-containing protein n=1 Tax=Deefgea piscis TaxID=2739061 RepID=A0A6M8SX59_9NEIS|nr:HD domain-containing phosphohydrolase [Deefgea piscis]QKJ67189.1 HD domain-containing protein [Deefgea piscis]